MSVADLVLQYEAACDQRSEIQQQLETAAVMLAEAFHFHGPASERFAQRGVLAAAPRASASDGGRAGGEREASEALRRAKGLA